MKLAHSRALLSASRSLRSCRGYQYRYTSAVQSLAPRFHSQRSFTTKAPPSTSPSSSPSNNKDDASFLSTQVRLLMRQVPYPVAIITSTDTSHPTSTTPAAAEPTTTSHFRGMTVSSFNTVTLTPQPIISFNVRRPSETLQALLSSGRFLVHLLAPNPQTASLARDFSRGNQNLALGEGQFEFVGIKPLVGTAAQDQTQSNSVTGNAAPNQEDALASLPPLPMLRRRGVSQGSSAGVTPEKGSDFDSFPFVFECRLLAESVSQVYDHTIVVGTIVRALTGSEDAEGSSEDLCLTYANTKFWEVGKEVV